LNNPAPRSHPYRAVVLDYGMVLCKAPTQEQVERIAEVFGVDHGPFWELYEKNRVLYDRGDLSPKEYWSRFAEETACLLDEATIERLQGWDIEMWSSLDPAMLEWSARLGLHGYKTGILSNLHERFVRVLRNSSSWLRYFDSQILSSEVRLAKPDPAIFRLCLRSLEMNGRDVLFVDDRQANVVAARSEGIGAICFRSVEQLRTELRMLGFDVLP
jgi:putative hydrolase of the HAD superfamily